MRHISLPGLSLAAGVVVAAVLALFVMGGGGGSGGPGMPPDQGGSVRLIPGDDASRAQYVTGAATGAVLGEAVRHAAQRSGAIR
jgi:hypothetical protein